uniref:MULE transposase domain-containing protein n=1 Tax=Lactuca sativa TaxID=4236 RepID=A0A9R1XB76_LACSA|nr:hypothetical protein LSAT_V11C500238610 [Lactuca sativa]
MFAYSEPNADLKTRMFKRIYVYLGSLKLVFKVGLRDFLGLDGDFMKGPYPGHVFTVVGLDSTNGIYPLAYAITEAETTSSWSWFQECLGEDLELSSKSNFTFISDRQKIMKLQLRGKEHKDHVCQCETTTIVSHFDRFMEDFKKFNSKVYDWLMGIPPIHWARAHMSESRSNKKEIFGRKFSTQKLIDARGKPIITCLEYCNISIIIRFILHAWA